MQSAVLLYVQRGTLLRNVPLVMLALEECRFVHIVVLCFGNARMSTGHAMHSYGGPMWACVGPPAQVGWASCLGGPLAQVGWASCLGGPLAQVGWASCLGGPLAQVCLHS